MQDADFLLNTFGIYPEFQNDLETRQTWVSFRLDGDNQTCKVRMVLPRKTDGQQKNECQVEGSIETYTTRYLLRKALGLCDDSDDPDAKPQGGGGGKKQQNKAQASTDAKATDGFSNVIDNPTDLDPSMIFNDKQCLKNSTIINWAKKQTKQMLNKI